MARSLQQVIAESRQISEQLLFTDLQIAFTFLQIARVTSDPKTRRRNIENATKAYRDVLHRSADPNLAVRRREDLDTTLALLRNQLAEFGVNL